MGSDLSKQKIQRAIPPVKIILNCHESVYEVVSKETIQLGDILLFPLRFSSNYKSIKHAGIYYGKRKVVHFDGKVLIEGIDAMERERGKCQILRLEQEIDEAAFQKKVSEMLNAEATYCPFTNNCIHFALSLLDKGEFYHKIVDHVDVDDGNNERNQMLPLNNCEDRRAHQKSKGNGVQLNDTNYMKDNHFPLGRASIICATGA